MGCCTAAQRARREAAPPRTPAQWFGWHMHSCAQQFLLACTLAEVSTAITLPRPLIIRGPYILACGVCVEICSAQAPPLLDPDTPTHGLRSV